MNRQIYPRLLCGLIILCTFYVLTLGQSSGELPNQIRKGVLRTNDGYSIKFFDMRQEGDAIFYKTKGSSTEQQLPVEQLYQVEERKGSWAGEVGLAGAGLGLVVGLINKGRVQREEVDLRRQGFTVIETDPTVLVLAPTIAGAIGGLIGGAFIKKDKVVFTNSQSGQPTGMLRFETGSFEGFAGIKWSLRF